ncbi:MAG TPA: PAS domain S-box protein [Pyrinomonadaceae bacterium]|nr:PAS domain S-box protein [Pyrinomonadaceae bacterium]
MNSSVPEEAGSSSRETTARSGSEAAPFEAAGDGRLLAFAENAADAIFIIDTESRIQFVNRAAEKIFGHAVEALLGQSLTLLMPDYLRHVHRAGLERYLETGARHISWSGVELPGLHRDGHEIELEISFGELFEDGARYFTGIARDITERKRATRRLAAHHAVAGVLAEAGSVREAARKILEAVCQNLRWEMGAFWRVEAGAGVLRCQEIWQASAEEPGEFAARTREMSFARGAGLPGRIWESSEPAWLADVTVEQNLPRAGVAAREGLRAAFGFPVMLGREVLGVMEFFSREVRASQPELHALMDTIGSQFGQFIERRRAERALTEAEERAHAEYERYRSLVAATSQVVWTTDAAGRIEDVPLWRAMTGQTKEEVRGAGWLDAVHPEDRERSATLWRRAVETRSHYTNEYRVRQRDGSYRYFAVRGVPIVAEDGSLREWVGTLADITERKQREASQRFLVEASAILAASLDYETTLQSVASLSVPFLADWCIVYVLDEEGAIRPIAVAHAGDSKQVESVWELERRRSQQRDDAGGVPKVIRTGLSELYAEIPRAGAAKTDDDAERFRVARELGLESAMIVPLLARGRTLGAITFATSTASRRYGLSDLALAEDLAQRAAFAVDNALLYREAQEANRLKDEFLATLSHELRTPLTSILGWTNLLRSVKFDEATAARALETIERNARSQKQLVDDLLDASRIITGKLRLEMRPTQLKTVVESACEAARPTAEAKGVELRLALEDGASVVAGDAERLQQVVWNLLSNAVKFTPEGGRVEVRLGREGTQARISVTDTGEGIKPEFLPYVFERFRQADQTTTRTHGGLGLGLAIVRHLVELHGGAVGARSEGEGRGATFEVRLPLLEYARRGETASGETAQREGSANEAAERQAMLGGLRILVVEDEPDTRVLLGKALERYGASVEACELAEEALDALERRTFDCILSDIAMPGEDGYTFIEKLRASDRAQRGGEQTPAIALTAYAREEDKQRALAAGFQLHLPKPVTPKELAEAVATVVGRTSKV